MADSDYPVRWQTGWIQARIRAIAGHRCEHCGMVFINGSNIAAVARKADGRPMVGTVHHLDGNKANCRYDNLVYLCQRCHLHVQAVWRPGGELPGHWPQPPEWIKKRKLPYRKATAVQLRLL